MISVIIPVYNQGSKLRHCLETLAKQSYRDFEVIIINDGSSDDPATIVKDYQNSFPSAPVFITQTNQGANAARNRGRAAASGEYLFFCDADASLSPDCLAKLLTTLTAHPEVSYVYSNFRYGWKLFRPGAFSTDRLRNSPFIHTSALIRASDFAGFDPSLKRFQDWDLWLTMLAHDHQGFWLDDCLFSISTGGTISSWLPSFVYQLLPWLPSVKAYRAAETIIKHKHALS